MNFDEFNINEEDYFFFKDLPTQSKILFLYDLICDGYYGSGSSESESGSVSAEIQDLKSLVDENINTEAGANAIVIGDKLIITSNTEENIDILINEMVMLGLIVEKYFLTEKAIELFCHQKYFKSFKIIGRSNRISEN